LAATQDFKRAGRLVKDPVAVEKGTKAVILVIFSIHHRPTFNLQANFLPTNYQKDFFNSHSRLHNPSMSAIAYA
jgi:hypothetical protein